MSSALGGNNQGFISERCEQAETYATVPWEVRPRKDRPQGGLIPLAGGRGVCDANRFVGVLVLLFCDCALPASTRITGHVEDMMLVSMQSNCHCPVFYVCEFGFWAVELVPFVALKWAREAQLQCCGL